MRRVIRDSVKFWHYETEWDDYRKRNPHAKVSPGALCGHLRSLFNKYVSDGDGCQASFVLWRLQAAVAEEKWIGARKPYYKLYPGTAVMLGRSSLSIPTECFRVPFDSFSILLPRTYQPEDVFGLSECIGEVRSFLVHSESATKIQVVSQRMVKSTTYLDLSKPTIEESIYVPFTGTDDRLKHVELPLIRLVVGVCLLATSVHRYVEHDVIAALRERYDNAASQEEREALAEKSKRRGVFGFCIGRGRCLDLTTQHGDRGEDGTGRELNYQHVRGGHFHTVAHGPGKSLRKVVFYEPTIVRPDLPPPPIRPYRAVT